MATTVKFEETKFVNELFPIKKDKECTVVFKPTGLISTSNLRNYFSTRKYITTSQLDMLDYMFGNNSHIETNPVIDLEDEDFNCIPDKPVFNVPGEARLKISTTGKDENVLAFNWIRYEFPKSITVLNNFINFIYYNDGVFYGIQLQEFCSMLKSLGYDKSKQSYDHNTLKELYNEFNSDTYHSEGEEILESFNLKSKKITLSKILISLLPDLDMGKIVEISDFINSEMLSSNKNKDEISKNIFELKGELITYFYNSKNYYYKEDGSLGGSCMRHDSTTEQIRFYANNPDHVSLLSLIEDKKLLARAVLWEGVDGIKFSDRIYCASSKHGVKLAAYCKAKGYLTIHSTTSSEYGIPLSHNCIVKLNTIELKAGTGPYLDSMAYIDVINKYLSPDFKYISNYLESTNLNYVVKSVNYIGGIGMYTDAEHKFRCNNSKKLKFLKDSYGSDIMGSLYKYAIIKKPKLSIVDRKLIITINENERTDAEWCENTLIKKYNSIVPTLLVNKNIKTSHLYRYVIHYYDKQFVVYSTYHKMHILKRDSEYVSSIRSYVLKDIIKSNSFQSFIKVAIYKRMYGGKLVRITPEYLNELKSQLAILPFKESLMDIRKSRVYNISIKNIHCDGVTIKGIKIPFKHLRFVKK